MRKRYLKSKIFFLLSRISLFFFIGISTIGFSKRTETEFQNIYLYDTLMLASDINSGLKIYSIKEPSTPNHLITIPLSGNSGSAMLGNIIFANSWDGIYAFKLNSDLSFDTISTIKKTYYEDTYYDPTYCGTGFFGCNRYTDASNDLVATSGTAGSYALFAVKDTFLYYLDNYEVITMSIANESDLRELSRTYVPWETETLFPTGNFLYLGGTNGMYVLSLENPSKPVMIGSMEHFNAYDPVVVKDSTAFVTLRSATRNVLLTVNVEDPTNPQLIKEYNVTTPYGLAIQDSLLYVSNGYNGFTLYNVSDPKNIQMVSAWPNAITKDFIWNNHLLYSMGFNTFSIYDVSDPTKPELLSTIY